MHNSFLSVRFLLFGSGSFTTEVFGLNSSEVGYQKSSVVLKESLLDFSLTLLVSVFLVKGYKWSADGESDGVYLRDLTSSADSDSDIQIGEFFLAKK